MNCLKTISVEHDFGKERLWFLSGIVMVGYFIVYYLIFRTFFSQQPLIDYGVGFLFFSLFLVFPAHLFLHCLPIWMKGKKATLGIRRNQWPYIYYSTKNALPKRIVLLSICSPAIVITVSAVIVTILFPQWLHYLAMISALNIGLCVYDYMNFKQLRTAPKSSLIEEHQDGFHILFKSQP
ncbi:DUF3267 domain-containing protein [Bacillus shivajii]|uniref:DUF3267 domain-containing protein n=1 Tax=Bacillus shivajii TaxID=1983719 RepID=UPI001CFA6738|nr:DUF3267 domain-containing protein [Bacillus shivajii]UCZ54322.1 DUF3267 domain-containing protein [Bacillus shivajii]